MRRSSDLNGWVVGIGLLIGIPIQIWYGYVLSVLWAWFAVPALGAPPLTTPYAIGLALIFGMFTYSLAKSTDVSDEHDANARVIKGLFAGAIGPLFSLGIGWIVRSFV